MVESISCGFGLMAESISRGIGLLFLAILGGWSVGIEILSASVIKKMNRFLPLVKAGCVAYLANEYIATVAWAEGPSMLPSINISGDLLLIEKISWRYFGKLAKGDIIVCISPLDPDRFIIKRVIALPQDQVSFNSQIIKIPKGTVWIEGDNLQDSRDSRDYGPVYQGLIQGRLMCRLWPTFTLFK